MAVKRQAVLAVMTPAPTSSIIQRKKSVSSPRGKAQRHCEQVPVAEGLV